MMRDKIFDNAVAFHMQQVMEKQNMEPRYYVIRVYCDNELYLIDVIDKIQIDCHDPKKSIYTYYYKTLNGEIDFEKVNDKPITKQEAEKKKREVLSKYFDDNGFYPKYNQDDFEREFREKYLNTSYGQGWSDWFKITEEEIEKRVDEGHLFGNYMYASIGEGEIHVDYVGRCTDEELQERIKHRLRKDDKHYKDYEDNATNYVKFRYAANEREAIEIECLLYHRHGGKAKLFNDIHPATTDDVKCPISLCELFE